MGPTRLSVASSDSPPTRIDFTPGMLFVMEKVWYELVAIVSPERGPSFVPRDADGGRRVERDRADPRNESQRLLGDDLLRAQAHGPAFAERSWADHRDRAAAHSPEVALLLEFLEIAPDRHGRHRENIRSHGKADYVVPLERCKQGLLAFLGIRRTRCCHGAPIGLLQFVKFSELLTIVPKFPLEYRGDLGVAIS